MEIGVSDKQPSSVQQVVLAISMVGAAVVFILIGRPPGWLVYASTGLLAILFLLTALSMWRASQWIGIAALIALLLAMFWEWDRPVNLLAGLLFAALSAWRAYHHILRGDDPRQVFTPSERAGTHRDSGGKPSRQ